MLILSKHAGEGQGEGLGGTPYPVQDWRRAHHFKTIGAEICRAPESRRGSLSSAIFHVYGLFDDREQQ